MKRAKPSRIGLALYLALFLWYSLIFFPIPRLLVPGTVGLFSLSSLLELFLVSLLAGNLLHVRGTDFFCLAILGLWGYLQYAAHWKYLIIPPSRKILTRYYRYFHGTLRFFPQSPTRLVPDAYHTVLGLLILFNFIVVSANLLHSMARRLDTRHSAA